MSLSQITLYGTDWCAECRRSKRLMDELNVAYTVIDIEKVPSACEKVKEINDGLVAIPVIFFADGTHLTIPSDINLTVKLSALGII